MLNIPEIGLVIHDLVGGNSIYIDDYLSIYEELFPQYARYTPVMRQRAERPLDISANEKWHQWILIVRGRPVGIIGFLYNIKRNTGVLFDFAIRSEAREIKSLENKSLAQLVLNLAMQQLVEDAQAYGYSAPLCMIAEVAHAPLVKKYMEYGYVEFPIEYFEPPSTPELLELSSAHQNLDKIGFERMYLGAFQIPNYPFNPTDPDIVNTVLLTLLEDHYHLPDNHWLIQKMLQETLNNK